MLQVLRDEGQGRRRRREPRLSSTCSRSQKNPQGGRLSKEMPISISNVLLVCTACGKPTRTGARFTDDGSQGTVLQEVRRRDRRDRPGARRADAKK